MSNICNDVAITFHVLSKSQSEMSAIIDAPIIGLVIGLVADMAISTVSVIGRNALRTDISIDSLYG